MECAYRLFALVEQEAAPQFGVFRPAEAYLREHLGDPKLTNARLAAAANVCEVYFRRLFRQKYGTSPRQYIVAARVGRAKQLLTGTRDSVTAIAAACGFSDIFHYLPHVPRRSRLYAARIPQPQRGYIIKRPPRAVFFLGRGQCGSLRRRFSLM